MPVPRSQPGVIIDEVKARFFIMVPFPCCIGIPDGGEMRIAHRNASLVHASVYKRDIKKNLAAALVAGVT
jgi:hypothetical protein